MKPVQIYADGSDYNQITCIYNDRETNGIKGFTTNPTLMRKAGVTNYLEFVKKVLETVRELPISFEVFADDFEEMKRQSLILHSLGKNVYVKIPITNTKGESSLNLVAELRNIDVKVNITAITTIDQIDDTMSVLHITEVPSIVSIFGGRIADTGVDPESVIQYAIELNSSPLNQILWASPREVFNIYQAEEIGCDIITVTPDLFKKYNELKGKDLAEYSLETVKMFYDDAQKSGYIL